MSSESKDHRTRAQLLEELEQLRWRVEEAEQTIEAIRHGDVDALVVTSPRGEQIYSVTGAEHVYRVIVETMNEAALTVDQDGTILFCNQRFCELMRTRMQGALGRKLMIFAGRPQQATLQAILTNAQTEAIQRRVTLRATDGTVVPVQISAGPLQADNTLNVCLVASDLTELEASANSIQVLREQQQALEESEARFRAIFESSQDALVIANDEGVYVQANPAVEAVFGLPAEQLVGRQVSEFMGGDIDFATFWRNLLTKGSLAGEISLTGVRGRVRRVEFFAIANIRPGQHLSVIHDITERKQAEEALQAVNEQLQAQAEELRAQTEELQVINEELTSREEELRASNEALSESEERFRTMADNISQLAWMADDTGRIFWYNKRWYEYTGTTIQEMEGWGWEKVHHPDHILRVTEKLRHCFETGEPWEDTFPLRATDGNYRWFLSRAIPIHDSRGAVVRWFGTSTDITRQKQAEQQLFETKQRLEALMKALPVGVSFSDDPTCRNITGNPAVLAQFEAGPEDNLSASAPDADAPGRQVRFFLDGRQISDAELPLQRAVAENREIPPMELEVRLPSGRRWFAATSGAPVHDAEGNVVGGIAVTVDITERKRAEEALRELNATLESKVTQRTGELQYRARQLQKLALELSEAEDRERKRIAEILHDDLQQILAAAKFHLNSIRNRARYDPPIQTTAAQIDHMLKDAIDKSRALSHELSPAVLHQGDFGDTLGWLASQIQIKHGLLVRVDAFSKVELQSDALRAFLYKAAQELLFNVVKHARINEARIRIRRWGHCICLSVSDRGRGFDPQELKATTGFGLFSIRERVELLGGRMRIKSIKGKGSIFHIVVPDGEISSMEILTKQEAKPAQGEGQRRLRLLIADDHEIVREGLISLLSDDHDIQVVGEAANGREAVDLADQLRPDVVIMDVAMPLIDGDEATRQIKQHMPDTRVIALSMYEEHENVEKMLAAGAEAYILKTASSDELLAAIRGKSPGA